MRRRRQVLGGGLGLWLGTLSLLSSLPATAGEIDSAHRLPTIGIIIDDLGNQYSSGLRTIALPGAVTCAFLPHTPFARRLAQEAHALGKEVMLHLPMQSVEERVLGPGGLGLDMTRQQFEATLNEDLAAVPHVRGVNNHMGSLLTRHPGHMEWLMASLAGRGQLYFVDSRTTSLTVAQKVAHERGLPSIERDVFLDHEGADEAYVMAQWEQLTHEARTQGLAVGIGHPYPATLEVLERVIPSLGAQGIRLLPISRLIALKETTPTWQAYLSPLPKAAKN